MLCFWTFLNASNNSFSSLPSQVSPTHHSANTFLMMIDRASTLLIQQNKLISSIQYRAGILWSGWQLTMRARRRPPSVPAWRKAIKNKNQIILQWKFFFTKSGSDYSELWNINDLSSPATRVAIVRRRAEDERSSCRKKYNTAYCWLDLCFLLIIIIVIALNSIYIENDEINKNFLTEIIITC